MNRRQIVYMIILLLALVGISFYGGPVMYSFFWIILFFPLSSAAYLCYVVAFLKIYQRTDGRSMVSGTPSDFYITLQNEGPFSFSAVRMQFYSSFSTIMDLRDDTVYELPPKTSVKKTTQLLCRYRGEYQVGIKKITVWDPFGVFFWTYQIKEPLSVIVAPALISLTEPHSMEAVSEADRDSYTDRSFPDITVREYLPGDDVRHIHWKSSAVMQKLMIRERIGEEKSGIAILMEGKRYGLRKEEYLPVENRIMETVLSLSEYYTRNYIPVDVFLQKEIPVQYAIRDAGSFEGFYEEMLPYSFREERSMQQMLLQWRDAFSASDYRLMVFVVHRWGEEAEALLEEYDRSNTPVILYRIGDEPEEEENIGERRERVCHRIRTDAVLQEVL